MKEFEDRLTHLTGQVRDELDRIGRCRVATKDDLDAMEARLTKLLKGGKPADLTALVEKGNELEAETNALNAAVNQNQPPKKES